MAEDVTVWFAEFNWSGDELKVQSFPSRKTAKQVKVDRGNGYTRTYDIERVQFSREDALAALRAKVESDLAFINEKRMTANKQLYALKKYEDELFLADRPTTVGRQLRACRHDEADE